jgi:hypothetical protein
MVTVGSILGDTFRFVRANLPSIAVWGAISLLMGIAMRAALGPVYRAQAEAIAQGVPPHFSFGLIFLAMLVMMVVMLMLYAAVFRAVLFPEQSAAFYLRLGRDEARLLGLMLVLWLGMMIAMVALIVITIVLGGVLALVLGKAVVAILAVVAVLFLYGLMAFVGVRLSLVGPLTILRRKITIGAAWRLTRGKFWTLFGTYFVIVLGCIPFAAMLMWPTFSQMSATIGQPGDPEAAARLMALQADQMSLSPTPGHILTLLLGSIIGAFFLAIFGGAPAMATLQLVEAQGETISD